MNYFYCVHTSPSFTAINKHHVNKYTSPKEDLDATYFPKRNSFRNKSSTENLYIRGCLEKCHSQQAKDLRKLQNHFDHTLGYCVHLNKEFCDNCRQTSYVNFEEKMRTFIAASTTTTSSSLPDTATCFVDAFTFDLENADDLREEESITLLLSVVADRQLGALSSKSSKKNLQDHSAVAQQVSQNVLPSVEVVRELEHEFLESTASSKLDSQIGLLRKSKSVSFGNFKLSNNIDRSSSFLLGPAIHVRNSFCECPLPVSQNKNVIEGYCVHVDADAKQTNHYFSDDSLETVESIPITECLDDNVITVTTETLYPLPGVNSNLSTSSSIEVTSSLQEDFEEQILELSTPYECKFFVASVESSIPEEADLLHFKRFSKTTSKVRSKIHKPPSTNKYAEVKLTEMAASRRLSLPFDDRNVHLAKPASSITYHDLAHTQLSYLDVATTKAGKRVVDRDQLDWDNYYLKMAKIRLKKNFDLADDDCDAIVQGLLSVYENEKMVYITVCKLNLKKLDETEDPADYEDKEEFVAAVQLLEKSYNFPTSACIDTVHKLLITLKGDYTKMLVVVKQFVSTSGNFSFLFPTAEDLAKEEDDDSIEPAVQSEGGDMVAMKTLSGVYRYCKVPPIDFIKEAAMSNDCPPIRRLQVINPIDSLQLTDTDGLLTEIMKRNRFAQSQLQQPQIS